MSTDVDLNNLELNDEPIEGFDEGADAYAAPPPIDDGLYLAKLSISKNNSEVVPFKFQDKTQYYLQLAAQIQDPGGPFDERLVFDMINTMPTKTADGKVTTRVASLLKVLGQKATGRPYADAVALKEALSTEPFARVKTQWQFQFDKEYQKGEDGKRRKGLKGQKNFPESEGGRHLVLNELQGMGGRTQAAVVRYEKAENA